MSRRAAPGRGGRRRPALTLRRGGRAGEPVGRRHRRDASTPGDAGGHRHAERLRAVPAVPRRGAGRARSRRRSTRRCAPTRSTTWSRDSGAALVIRSADDVDGAEPLTEPSTRRPGRRRRALLHVGHDRQAQGRRAHPPGAGRPASGGAVWPAALQPRRGRVRPAGRPHHGVPIAARARPAPAIPVYFLPALPPGARCSTRSRRAGPPSSSACPRCTG